MQSVQMQERTGGMSSWLSIRLNRNARRSSFKKNLFVNLVGVMYTVRAVVYYFSQVPNCKYQLILTGSAAR